MLGGVGVLEAVFEDTVDEGVVTEFRAFAEGWEVVGNVGHGFGAASDDDRGVARHDGLGGEDDGFCARGADFVDGGANGGVAKAGIDSTLSCRVLAETASCGM